MKKPATNRTEYKCPECKGTGFRRVEQPVELNRKIYPPPCTECGGKGNEGRQLRR